MMKLTLLACSTLWLSSLLLIPASFADNAYDNTRSSDKRSDSFLYHYESDSWNDNDLNASYTWLSHLRGCSTSVTPVSVTITQGIYTCWRSLTDKQTYQNTSFMIRPDDDFDISFNVYKSTFGSNYQAHLHMTSDDYELFYWLYDKDGEDYFRTPVGEIGIEATEDHRYRIKKTGDLMRVYINGEVVAKGEYSVPEALSLKTYIGVHNSRLHFSNLSVKVLR